jgi:GNAT superfamily N-acetyltransferase
MAAVATPAPSVRAPYDGEGRAIARLWRELWDVHESWGGYPGEHDEDVYERVAERLDADARLRTGKPALGRHIHLIAELGSANHGSEPVGQVEGWFDRHGIDPLTPYTCEVRSLIVTERARKTGAGRALLDVLANVASDLARGGSVVLAAEVLEPNPAHAFYRRVGYSPVSWTARLDVAGAPAIIAPLAIQGFVARVGEPRDALAIALLESMLATRRRASGDARFDRPRQVDASLLHAIAAHLGRGATNPPVELVVTDREGRVRGSATLVTNRLELPFVPQVRAILARTAIDAAVEPGPIVRPLVELGRRVAAFFGARWMEVVDLTGPSTPLFDAVLGCGAIPWSRIVCRFAPVRARR